MSWGNLAVQALSANKYRKAQRVLQGPFRAANRIQQGWTSHRFDSGYTLEPASVGQSYRVSWQIPKQYSLEVHGHSFVLLDRKGARLGEVRLDANGPSRLVHSFDARGSKHGCGEIAVEASHTMTVNIGTKEGLIVDRGVSEPEGNWKLWIGERLLTYKVENPISKTGRTKLCVVFSAISGPFDFTYNYRSALGTVDAYKVYILDNFGSQGSYYFADHRDTSIFETVQKCIIAIADQLEIEPENIAFVGSSKGGTAALAHGLKMGVGRIVVGAPQFLPGTYLIGAAPKILSFIAGDDSSESIKWLDQLITTSAQQSGTKPSVSVLVGTNDSHHHIHVQPFMRWSEGAGVKSQALVVEDLSHQNIGRAFGLYAASVLAATDESQMQSMLPYSFEWREESEYNEVQLKLWVPGDERISVVIESEDGTETFAQGEGGSYFKAVIPPGLNVRARVFRQRDDGSGLRGFFETRTLSAPRVKHDP